MSNHHPRSIRLTEDEENKLLALAERFECFARAGSSTGSPSWQVLVKRIGAGSLFVVEAEETEEMGGEEVVEEKAVAVAAWWERRNESAGIVESLRVLIEGPSRSGKTTILHSFLSHALRFSWFKVLLLDGKGELSFYRDVEDVVYYGPTETESWAEELAEIAEAYPIRFAAMFDEGFQQRGSSEPGVLVIIDEANHGLGDELDGKVRKSVSHSLRMIASKGGALNDGLWVTVPYVEALPKAVRVHANARFSMAGKGFFHLKRKGFAPSRGRCQLLTPAEVIAAGDSQHELPVSLEGLPGLMGVKVQSVKRSVAYLVLGKQGSGKSHTLREYQQHEHANRVLIDCSDTLKNNLISVSEQCYASPPSQLNTEELFTFASQALCSIETLLLVDNLDRASATQAQYILKLVEFAAECCLVAKEPEKSSEDRLLLPFRQRCHVLETPALSREDAEYLLDENLPTNLENEKAVRRFILNETDNPGEMVRLARSVRIGDIEELRQLRSTSTKKPIELTFPLLIFALIWLMTWFRMNPAYIGFGMILLIVFRPLVRRSATKLFKRGG